MCSAWLQFYFEAVVEVDWWRLAVLRAEFGLQVETLTANIGCCQRFDSQRCLESTIAFGADTERLKTARNQSESCSIAPAVEEANEAKHSKNEVTAGSKHREDVECSRQRQSAAPCIGPAGAAGGIVPEPESDLSALGSNALVVPDPVALQLHQSLDCTGWRYSLTVKVAATMGRIECTASGAWPVPMACSSHSGRCRNLNAGRATAGKCG